MKTEPLETFHTSCHPGGCKRCIPYAQALRLRRICSTQEAFEKRVTDLCHFLMARGYDEGFVQDQVQKAREKDRNEVLIPREDTRNNRIPFVVTYNPTLPNIGALLQELHPVLHSSQRCKNAIKEVPMMAYRRPKNLQDHLVRAKLCPRTRSGTKGTTKCTDQRCEVCTYTNSSDTFVSSVTKKIYSINYSLGCNSKNVIYLITCKKCGLQYVGSTSTKFRMRFNNHKSRVTTHPKKVAKKREEDDFIYKHFNSDGHQGLDDLSVQLIDRVNRPEELLNKEGEWAYKLKTIWPNGLNESDFFFNQNRHRRRR